MTRLILLESLLKEEVFIIQGGSRYPAPLSTKLLTWYFGFRKYSDHVSVESNGNGIKENSKCFLVSLSGLLPLDLMQMLQLCSYRDNFVQSCKLKCQMQDTLQTLKTLKLNLQNFQTLFDLINQTFKHSNFGYFRITQGKLLKCFGKDLNVFYLRRFKTIGR